MLGKQSLNRYAQVEARGSVVDRSRHRQLKISGMVTWHFDLVMEILPIMLQVAILLLGYSLSNYLLTINKVVAGVTIGFTSFGVLFYLLIVSAAIFSHNCPFQTPASLILRFAIRFDDEHRKYLRRARRWIKRKLSFPKRMRQHRREPAGPYPLGTFNTFDASTIGDHIELVIANPSDLQAPLFNRETDWHGYVLDSICVAWALEMSRDEDVVLAIMKFIPEVVWHSGTRIISLERLYESLLECFDLSSGSPVVIPKYRDKAYFGARALFHLAIQRKCIGHESGNAAFRAISYNHLTVGSRRYEGDSDLESTLSILNYVFGDYDDICWHTFSLSTPHHAWMGHILLYRAWDLLRNGESLRDDIKGFVLHSLALEPPPPALIVTDCLFIIGLVLGIGLHIDDLLVIDKRLVHPRVSSGMKLTHPVSSHEQNRQLGRIYTKLVETIQNANASNQEIYHALEAMDLIAPLSENDIATKSYDLFRVVMQAPVTGTYTQEKKWQAARFTMHGAYKWDKFLPCVEDPQDILAFLGHHFGLATQGGENQDEPIQNALRALAYASSATTIEALKDFDPTETSFVRGIRYVFQDDKPLQLRKAALFFLPLIGDRWFNTPTPIMESDQMEALCADWASAVDGIEHTYNVQKATLAVLFNMINSSHWRPHIVPNKWKLLDYFTSVPDDSQPLRRCLDNPELTIAISEVKSPAAMVLWLAILWLKYKELIPEVQAQVESFTKEVAQDSRRTDLDVYLSVMDSELKKAEDALTRHNAWSTDPAAVLLRTKIDNLQQARGALLTLKRG